MLHLTPAPLHRALLRAGSKLRQLWYRLARLQTYGVCAMLRDAEGRVLLVRHSYGTSKWSLPAGGAARGEEPEAAIRREIREELGCALVDLVLVEERDDLFHRAPNHVWVFTASVTGEVRPDLREILEAQFFALDALPADLERRVRSRLAHLEQQ